LQVEELKLVVIEDRSSSSALVGIKATVECEAMSVTISTASLDSIHDADRSRSTPENEIGTNGFDTLALGFRL
jgi:hypothetical protein